MTVNRVVRVIAGFFILLSLALGVSFELLVMVYRICRCKPVPERFYQLVPDGYYPEKTRGKIQLGL